LVLVIQENTWDNLPSVGTEVSLDYRIAPAKGKEWVLA